jgi:hypothetical protein
MSSLLFIVLFLLIQTLVLFAASSEDIDAANMEAMEEALKGAIQLDFSLYNKNDEFYISILTEDGYKICDGKLSKSMFDEITCSYDKNILKHGDNVFFVTVYSTKRKEIVMQTTTHFYYSGGNDTKTKLMKLIKSPKVLWSASAATALGSTGLVYYKFTHPKAPTTNNRKKPQNDKKTPFDKQKSKQSSSNTISPRFPAFPFSSSTSTTSSGSSSSTTSKSPQTKSSPMRALSTAAAICGSGLLMLLSGRRGNNGGTGGNNGGSSSIPTNPNPYYNNPAISQTKQRLLDIIRHIQNFLHNNDGELFQRRALTSTVILSVQALFIFGKRLMFNRLFGVQLQNIPPNEYFQPFRY